MRLAIPLIALLLVAEPSAAIPPSVPSEPPHRDLFTLELTSGGLRQATFVEPHADGTVSYLEPDGTIDYVAMVRIRRVTDERGADLTAQTLRGREWLGTPPVKPFTEKPQTVWKPYRYRPAPKSLCEGFLITESALLWHAATVQGYGSNEEQKYQGVDYGYARNVSPRGSVGGSLFLEADGARTHAGMRLRMFRWLSPDAALDLSPGIILVGNEEENSSFVFPGFSGRLGVTAWQGRIGAVGQVVSARRRWLGREDTETLGYVGLRVGAEPGIMGSMVLGVIGLSALSTPEFRPSGF